MDPKIPQRVYGQIGKDQQREHCHVQMGKGFKAVRLGEQAVGRPKAAE